LVKKLDAAAVANKDCKMGSFVVLMTDDDKMEDALKKMAEKEGLKKVVLTIDNPTGPPKWKIEKDADVTVILYAKNTVKESMAFEKGKLDDKAIEKVIAGLDSIKPEKKDK
jgi:archaellum component FlaG (FlaF/FlaG flagellin family)